MSLCIDRPVIISTIGGLANNNRTDCLKRFPFSNVSRLITTRQSQRELLRGARFVHEGMPLMEAVVKVVRRGGACAAT